MRAGKEDFAAWRSWTKKACWRLASRLVRDGKSRVNAEMASIFERVHVDAERWQASLLSLLKPDKLVGQYFGGLQSLRATAARLGQRWVKNRGTRLAIVRADAGG